SHRSGLRLRQGRLADGRNSKAVRHARGSGRREEKESQARGPLAQPLRLLPATGLRRAGGRLANLAGAQNLYGRTQVSERVAMPGRMAGLMAASGGRIE